MASIGASLYVLTDGQTEGERLFFGFSVGAALQIVTSGAYSSAFLFLLDAIKQVLKMHHHVNASHVISMVTLPKKRRS
jgi:hypothetical protein